MLKRVLIEPAVRASLVGHTRTKPDVETGGILLGRRTDIDTLLLTRASPPGPQARHRRFSFLRDTAFLQDYLDAAHARSGGGEDYVGEWHVHPALGAPPSRTDRRSLRRIARSSRYAVAEPVLLIVEHSPPELRLRCYRFAGRSRRGTELPLLGPG
ncbi:MAG TPA: Mov34/MPN/PAD-1 family protein [Solirubrobacterales bacterium]|nr:Mov34/MPN/PAD-1 family protein [Solirubrobacterales bacterium]